MADRSFEVYVAFLSATHHATLMIGEVARAPLPATRKRQAIAEHLDPMLDRVNSALEAVMLVGGDEVRGAAFRLDSLLIDLDQAALEQEFAPEAWRQLRDAEVNPVLNQFRDAAARELKGLGRTL